VIPVMFDKILVAYHGTDRALRAFDAAVQMAQRQNSELHMISVAEDVPRHAELIAEVEDAMQREDSRYSQLASQAKLRAALYSVSLHCDIVVGHRVRAIIDFVQKGHFELLVIGESRSSVSGLVFGSTSEKLTNRARCSVLVVK
jgi:nucleotide-binding universal stress UspA family protein